MLNLSEYRKFMGLTQEQLAKKLDVAKNTISQWETGKREPDLQMLKKISSILNIQIDQLLDNKIDKEKNKIPVLGRIPAGIPIEMIEDIMDYEDIPVEWLTGNREYFALKIKGDSMFPKFLENDVIIVRKQNDCENGAYAVVAVNGDDATFKKILKKENGIILQPLNEKYEPLVYTNEDVQKLPIRILGVVVEIRRSV